MTIKIIYNWIGEPKFHKTGTGHDVLGPILTAQKISQQNQSKLYRVILTCEQKYKTEYEHFFSNQNISVEVISYEEFFQKHLEDELMEKVKYHYENANDNINEQIPLKNLLSIAFSYFMGGHVYDTNVIPRDNKRLKLKKPTQFTCPIVSYIKYTKEVIDDEKKMESAKVYEVWGRACPVQDEIAKEILTKFLNGKDKIDKRYKDLSKDKNSAQYKDDCADMLTNLFKKTINTQLIGDYKVWELQLDKNSSSCIDINDTGMNKFYFNVHKSYNQNRSDKTLILNVLDYCLKNRTHYNLFEFLVKTIDADITEEYKSGWSLLHNIVWHLIHFQQTPSASPTPEVEEIRSGDDLSNFELVSKLHEVKAAVQRKQIERGEKKQIQQKNIKYELLEILLSSENSNLKMLASINTQEGITPLHLAALSKRLDPAIFTHLKNMRVNINAEANFKFDIKAREDEEKEFYDNKKENNCSDYWKYVLNNFNQLGIKTALEKNNKNFYLVTVRDILESRKDLDHPNAIECINNLEQEKSHHRFFEHTSLISHTHYNEYEQKKAKRLSDLENDTDDIVEKFDHLISECYFYSSLKK